MALHSTPAIRTTASPKSNWAWPGGWLSGTNTSFLASPARATAARTARSPRCSRTRLAGARRSAWPCDAAWRGGLVGFEDLVDDAEERRRAWALGDWIRLAIAGGLRVGQDLLQRLGNRSCSPS